ncbi:MAG: PSD1 and planctomycete cytochrome C domain-containing protein [Planctomycetota bacterium]|nr:PSD1 and planctomycete cytochrome C domain-containing protein [Planctomycetota bacterium]
MRISLSLILSAGVAIAPRGGWAFSYGVEWSDVRNVIETRCLPCHGGERVRGGLKLTDASAFARGGDRGAVVDQNDLANSRILQVIAYENPQLAMPPSGMLPEAERELLSSWVLSGAFWPEQAEGVLAPSPTFDEVSKQPDARDAQWWSYQPIVAPVHVRQDLESPSEAIDFLLDEHRSAYGLDRAEEASPEQLLRRANFDLLGLPPTPEETQTFVSAWLEDPSEAWSGLIDRLLESPAYGEHWARFWLDQVRFAETNGYERDSTKPNIWRYRDWVIRCLNEDLPYDDFLRYQIAGDEYKALSDARHHSISPELGTGFFRLGVWDDEPADRTQAKADHIADIVDITAQLAMGMTLGCARCHDHKADPISQRDYFAFTAYFNNITDYGDNHSWAKRPESIRLVADGQGQETLSAEDRDVRVEGIQQDLLNQASSLGLLKVPTRNLLPDARHGGALWRYWDGAHDEGFVAQGFDDSGWPEARGGFGEQSTPGASVHTPWHTKQIALRHDFVLNKIPDGLILSVHHDEDALIFLNGVQVASLEGFGTDYFDIQLPLAALDALVVGSNTLAVLCRQSTGGQYIDVGLRTGWLDTSEAKVERLRSLTRNGGEENRAVQSLLDALDRLLKAPVVEPYEALVVAEYGTVGPEQRIHLRGSAHAEGDRVDPAIPDVLAWTGQPIVATSDALKESSGRRHALAEWLTVNARDISARVLANKLWQGHFGRGIARTSGDFGRLGDRPTHPELLEHLAQRVLDHNWSLKAMHREIMLSQAYRMASRASDQALAADQNNDHLQRRDPRRLTAEQYRDAVLHVTGQLNRKMFGPSVYPEIEPEVLATASRPNEAWGRSPTGEANRRSIYVFAKRSLRFPLFESFDQPSPDSACLVRFDTNVPTQSLLTLNGNFINDAARHFVDRLSREADDLPQMIERGIRLAFGRAPHPEEVQRHLAFLHRISKEFELSDESALVYFALGLLNANEFMWID